MNPPSPKEKKENKKSSADQVAVTVLIETPIIRRKLVTDKGLFIYFSWVEVCVCVCV